MPFYYAFYRQGPPYQTIFDKTDLLLLDLPSLTESRESNCQLALSEKSCRLLSKGSSHRSEVSLDSDIHSFMPWVG